MVPFGKTYKSGEDVTDSKNKDWNKKEFVYLHKTAALMKKEVENKTVIIKNPSEKMKAFIKKMEEDKISRRQELLKSGNYTFTI